MKYYELAFLMENESDHGPTKTKWEFMELFLYKLNPDLAITEAVMSYDTTQMPPLWTNLSSRN